MWHHATTKKNLETITAFGNHIIPVENGELASGLVGDGRMSEPQTILDWLNDFFLNGSELKGKKVLITAGPTFEQIDPVRFIGNHSSGKMGVAIAEEMHKRGAHVTLVLGPSDIQVNGGIEVIKIKSADEMFNACEKIFPAADIAIMSAAVSDYTPVNIAKEKIKKTENDFSVQLTKTRDILKHLGGLKRNGQVLVGFALETNNEKENALKKLRSKNADLIVLNSLNDEGAGFGLDTNKITIFDKNGKEYPFETKSKREVAIDIINTIIQLLHAKI
jgi:phosphopantothenoylcysteine decarboxylase/phosphopantothenate--cysteine ligase